MILYCSYSTQRRGTLEGILAQQQKRREVPPKEVREPEWNNLRRVMDSPTERVIKEVVVPTVVAVGSTMLFPPAGVPALVAQGARAVIPALPRIATALGIGALSGTINYMSKGGDNGKDTGGSSLGKERVINTPQEVKSYIKGLKDKGVLDNGRKCAGNHYAYKFTRDCEYNGIKFKKDQFISEDTRHHEIEWFKDKNTHLGAIEPKNGTQYKIADPDRRLIF